MHNRASFYIASTKRFWIYIWPKKYTLSIFVVVDNNQTKYGNFDPIELLMKIHQNDFPLFSRIIKYCHRYKLLKKHIEIKKTFW